MTNEILRAYSKPAVSRFGSFRELTQFGFDGLSDGISVDGIGDAGCNVAPGSCPTTS